MQLQANAIKVVPSTHKHLKIHWILKTGQSWCSATISKDVILKYTFCLPAHKECLPIFHVILFSNRVYNEATKSDNKNSPQGITLLMGGCSQVTSGK